MARLAINGHSSPDLTLPLLCVAPDSVVDFWPFVRPMIEASYDRVDEFMPDEMLVNLRCGFMLLWVSAPGNTILAALITALVRKPSGLFCKLMACGGTGMEVWAHGGHMQIEAYARAEGCSKMTAEGREGWARVLPGYDVKRVVLEKRLG